MARKDGEVAIGVPLTSAGRDAAVPRLGRVGRRPVEARGIDQPAVPTKMRSGIQHRVTLRGRRWIAVLHLDSISFAFIRVCHTAANRFQKQVWRERLAQDRVEEAV